MKNIFSKVPLAVSFLIFIGVQWGCGGRTFGFDECEDDSQCPDYYICGPKNLCVPYYTVDSDIAGAADTDTSSDRDSETDTTTDSALENSCPFNCLFYTTCDRLGGIEDPSFECSRSSDVCCVLSLDTESTTDAPNAPNAPMLSQTAQPHRILPGAKNEQVSSP